MLLSPKFQIHVSMGFPKQSLVPGGGLCQEESINVVKSGTQITSDKK